MSDADRIGEQVTVEGRAYPGAAGAIVESEGTSYYLGGVNWGTDMVGKRVVVSGVLRVRQGYVKPAPADEEQSHGLSDDTLLIEAPQWRLAD